MILASDFEILGIDKTTDIRQIKRAYAKKVKECSPEEDAMNFQLLREAYERVLEYAELGHVIEEKETIYDRSSFAESLNTEDIDLTAGNSSDEHHQQEEYRDSDSEYGILDSDDSWKSVPKYRTLWEDGTEADTESGTEVKSESGTEVNLESRTEVKSESGREVKSESRTEVNSQSRTEVNLEDGAEADSEDETWDESDDYDWVDEESEYNPILIDDFFEQIHTVYSDFKKRNDLEVWMQLTKHEALWSLNELHIVSRMFLNEVAEGKFLDKKIILLLNEHFHWEDEDEEFFEEYYGGFVKYILECINDESVPGYEYLSSDMKFDIDEFIRYREYGYINYLNGDWDNAHQNYCKAFELFPEEPYLLCQIELLRCIRDEATKGAKNVKEVIASAADSDAFRLFCGRMGYQSRSFDTSNYYYRKISTDSEYYSKAIVSITINMCELGHHLRCFLMLMDKMKKELQLEAVKDSLRILYSDMAKKWEESPRGIRRWFALRRLFLLVGAHGDNPYKVHQMVLNSILKPLFKLCLIALFLLLILAIPGVRGIVILYWIGRTVFKKSTKGKKG